MGITLRVQNFRKHRDYTAEFSGNNTVIMGPNGSGKTSLIEAIFVALTSKSWRSNFDEITRTKSSWWRIDVIYGDEKRIVKYKNGEREFIIDGQTFRRLPAKYKKSVVLFEPSDLNLLYGSPVRRRDYIDKFLGSIDVKYAANLRRYERILKQRNNLLKNGATRDGLFIWDMQLADQAANIIADRRHLVQQINKHLTDEYQKIAGNYNKIAMEYDFYSDSPAVTRQKILGELHRNYQHEVTTGHTSVGPHQHDLTFLFDGKPAATTASRGENRSIILALKNIEYKLKKDDTPLILLDDILSEFDEKHQTNLLKNFGQNQTIITGVKAPKTAKNLHRIQL
ncbi:DNA replication and repair protein RecF [Alphaproteobacteria bacterium]|nr:DNA replication and repair protein RecF [Alphaproteobacteria bacterium]